MKYTLATAFLCATFAFAQGITQHLLEHPTADSWPSYNGDYSGRRYSELHQINKDNVNRLTPAWSFRVDIESQRGVGSPSD